MMFSPMLFSHEGHDHEENQKIEQQATFLVTPHDEENESNISKENSDSYNKIIHWLGNFHPIFLHFPIALIAMTVISELLLFWFGNPLFDHASRFMIIAAAITVIPTALFGFAYGYHAHYEGDLATLFEWHQFSGIFTTLFTIAAATLRELHSSRRIYYICLTIIFISVNLTAYFGGEMTFGPGHLWP